MSPGMLWLLLPQRQNDATASSQDAEAALMPGTGVGETHHGCAGVGKGPGRIKPFVVMNVPSPVLEMGLFEPSLGAFLSTERWPLLLELPSPQDGSGVRQEPEPQIYQGTSWEGCRVAATPGTADVS